MRVLSGFRGFRFQFLCFFSFRFQGGLIWRFSVLNILENFLIFCFSVLGLFILRFSVSRPPPIGPSYNVLIVNFNDYDDYIPHIIDNMSTRFIRSGFERGELALVTAEWNRYHVTLFNHVTRRNGIVYFSKFAVKFYANKTD